MISWWWLIILVLIAFGMGILAGICHGQNIAYNDFRKLELRPEDIQLSEARLEALWLSKQLENIATLPNVPCPDCCKAERWRNDANKWAKKTNKERIKEKTK